MWTCYENDVAYILLADEHPGEAAISLVTVRPKQETLKRVGVVDGSVLQTSHVGDERAASIADTVESLILEFDNDNQLIAIEIWGASKGLPKSFLELAARETRPKPIRPK